MANMRNLYIVIDQLLEAAPLSEESLRARLTSVQTKIMYAAPETLGYHWRAVAWILETHTVDNSSDWVKVTRRIFNNQPFGN